MTAERRVLSTCWETVARLLEPVDRVPVSVWAERERYVSAESGSPRPGRWSHDVVPYLTEILDVADIADPTPEVVIVGSAQCGKSEVGLNVLGSMICQDPCPALIVLPSIEEARKYSKIKLNPLVNETPAIKARVYAQSRSPDAENSTTFLKKFLGGFAAVVTANSSKGLQMISARLRIFEEVAGYPADVEGRGPPIQQANARAKAWSARGSKAIYISTPSIAGSCVISELFARSDQRRWYVPCPHCGAYQVIRWERMRWSLEGRLQVWYECAATGCRIDPAERPAMIARGRWIPTYDDAPEDPGPPPVLAEHELDHWASRSAPERLRGYHIWQGISPFVTWESTVREYLAAQERGQSAMRVFWQQALGEPWVEHTDTPDAARLLERKQSRDKGIAPREVLFLVGATDVHAQRLEWALWGFDRHLTPYLVDYGELTGDTAEDEVWRAHDELLARRWRDEDGRPVAVARWGIDTGYRTTRVYAHVRQYAPTGKLLALDGRAGWKLPPIGTPRVAKYKVAGATLGVMIYPVGTFDIKSDIYARIRLTVEAPNADELPRRALRLPASVDLDYCRQLVSEQLVERRRQSGEIVLEWVKARGVRNEALDLLVYCMALAHHETAPLDERAWARLEAMRGVDHVPVERVDERERSDARGEVYPEREPADTIAAGEQAVPRSRRSDRWLGVSGRWL